MKPTNFRNESLGIKGMYVVLLNEINAFKANKGKLLSMTMQPILYFAFLIVGLNATSGKIIYEGRSMPYTAYAVVGVLSLIMTTQMSESLYRSTIDKQFGLMAIKFISGVTPLYYILGMSIFPFIGYLYQSAILFILCIPFKILKFAKFLPLSILLGLFMLLFWTSLGIFFSTLFSNYQQRDIFIQLIFTPVTFTAPAFYLESKAPLYIKTLANINPMTYQLQALRAIAYGHFSILKTCIAVLPSILALIFVSFALRKTRLTLQEK
ncbi:ABC transporter permease [Ligilactobacillus sp. LYQ112]|uniref:ABC transporter permease n=1 Tax=Ligilactobacillus sp. LYQ112 TaxID=3391060 RepID=UPI003983693B